VQAFRKEKDISSLTIPRNSVFLPPCNPISGFCISHLETSHCPFLTVTDEELIAGCKDGKRELQKALYKRFSAKMLGVCLRYTKNREEAEDILQEGFIKVFKNLSQYQGAGSFEGWIRKIMVNTALESIRRTKLTFSVTEIQDLEDDFKADDDVMNKIGVKDLLAMIQDLSKGYQVVFNLYAIEGYQHNEIASMLGISEGTSKSQLARARMILQKKIRESNLVMKRPD
jgi:RNA polymerase sigma factor (sigma-70 family)